MNSIKCLMERLCISIKAIFHHKTHFKEATQSQIDLFDRTKPGDLLFCDMPLSKTEIERIEEGHRSRPYLIAYKNNKFLIGYQCSSKELRNPLSSKFHKLSFSKYNLRKKQDGKSIPTDTNVDLRSIWILYPSSIRFFMTKVDEYDLVCIERKIQISNDKQLKHFNVKTKAMIGDIYLNKRSLYYVYQEYKDDLSCFTLSEVDYKNRLTVTINNKNYSINIDDKKQIKLSKSKLVYICDQNKIETVKNKLSKIKLRKIQSKRKQLTK